MKPSSTRTVLSLLLLLLPLLLLGGCGDDSVASSTDAGGDGDVAGDGDGDGPVACVIPDGAGADVSFRQDVMPTLSLSCTLGPCHGNAERESGLYLGPRCEWNADAGRCEFPPEPDPRALTDGAVAEVLANLVDVPSTTTPSTLRIAAGDPAASFLMEKVTATHNDVGHDDCMPQHAQAASPCGDAMPPTGAALCEQGTGPELVDMLARWIAQGARDN